MFLVIWAAHLLSQGCPDEHRPSLGLARKLWAAAMRGEWWFWLRAAAGCSSFNFPPCSHAGGLTCRPGPLTRLQPLHPARLGGMVWPHTALQATHQGLRIGQKLNNNTVVTLWVVMSSLLCHYMSGICFIHSLSLTHWALNSYTGLNSWEAAQGCVTDRWTNQGAKWANTDPELHWVKHKVSAPLVPSPTGHRLHAPPSCQPAGLHSPAADG